MTQSTQSSSFNVGLDKNDANYVALSPCSFLQRTAHVYPDRVSIIHGERRFTWRETYTRARRLASALHQRGIGSGDTVAVMLPNVPAMLEAHFGIPMLGAVINTLNTRQDPETIAFMLAHGEAKVLLTDREYSDVIARALRLLGPRRPLVIDVDDEAAVGERLGSIENEYEALLATGDPEFVWSLPRDEWQAIALNYTSGTTGDPKGVVTHHRGAYLNAISNIVSWGMPQHAVYLWTLPMFHCNGWCFPWTVTANAGTHVCLRRIDVNAIFDAIRKHDVTHYAAAPIVHNLLAQADPALRHGIEHKVRALVAGAAPPPAIIESMERNGFELTHVYGLTETYGPAAVCAKQAEWADLTISARAELNGRQGVPYHLQEAVTVLDPETMQPVPWDGETMGEVMFRGNIVMKGYLKNPDATERAFRGGYFHTGDLAVVHADGYIKIKDRSKDVIISGGENISSLEVEEVIYRHPAVMVAAVVAKPDARWGEVPCAFVELKEGAEVSESELIEHCRSQLAHFKVPKQFVLGLVPKTSTGKIKKFALREQMQSSSAIR
jgi:fatty-acyl-CoA synthase